MSGTRALPFTPERQRTLSAVVCRILPGTFGPGAAATDAAVSIERAMGQLVFAPLRPGMEAMLDQLQAHSARRYGAEFASCTADQQDTLVRAIEQDQNAAMRFLFRSLIALSLEGLLGDPAHGGNRDFLGWEFIGRRAGDVRAGFCRVAQEG